MPFTERDIAELKDATTLNDGGKRFRELFRKKIFFNEQTPSQEQLQFYVDKVSTLEAAVKQAARNRNLELMEMLVQLYTEDRVSIILSAQVDTLPSLEQLRTLPAPEHARQLAWQFTGDYGNIDCAGVLLTCAKIRERKASTEGREHREAYDFSPVVCGDIMEFSSMCQQIATNSDFLLRQKITFLAIGMGHWRSGRIEISAYGEISVLFVDSLGVAKDGDDDLAYARPLTETIHHILPDANVYYSAQKRQRTSMGCSIFALDDARNLQHLDNYLPPEFAESGLPGYLAVHTTNDNPHLLHCGEQGHYVNLPERMLRTMQSRDVLPLVSDVVVNKRGLAGRESVEQHFTRDNAGNYVRNERLQYKYEKMRDQNIAFLEKHTDEECQAAMDYFRVASFAARLRELRRKSCHEVIIEPELVATKNTFTIDRDQGMSLAGNRFTVATFGDKEYRYNVAGISASATTRASILILNAANNKVTVQIIKSTSTLENADAASHLSQAQVVADAKIIFVIEQLRARYERLVLEMRVDFFDNENATKKKLMSVENALRDIRLGQPVAAVANTLLNHQDFNKRIYRGGLNYAKLGLICGFFSNTGKSALEKALKGYPPPPRIDHECGKRS